MSALYAVNGTVAYASDGICAETPVDCIKNMARIGNNGMVEADKEILNIMVEKWSKSGRMILIYILKNTQNF